jgi:DNA-binding NarL/FixJ family response regulator
MPLSPKQLEVARLVARGMGNAAIGAELGIVTGTVARHVHEAMKKLRAQGLPVENRTGLAMYVHENDLLDEASGAEDGGPP